MSFDIRNRVVARSAWLILFHAALFLSVAVAEAQPPGGAGAAPPVDTIAIPVGVLRRGDGIRVSVLGAPELSGEFTIDNTGVVQIPGIGDFHVEGTDPATVRTRILEAMSRHYRDPEIGVQALIHVIVQGAVREPRIYAVVPGTTVLQVLAMAGGATPNADLQRAHVVRSRRANPVDLEAALFGSISGQIQLFSGDVVYVPVRTGFTRENVTYAMGFLTVGLTLVNLILTLQR